MQKKYRVAFAIVAAVAAAACSKGEASDSAATNQAAHAAELLKAAGGDLKVVEASGGDIEKAKLLAAGKKLAENAEDTLDDAAGTKVPPRVQASLKTAREYDDAGDMSEPRVIKSAYDGTVTHAYLVAATRQDGSIVYSWVGFEPGEKPKEGDHYWARGVGPDGTMNFDQIKEIEEATGREYREGDTIYGRAVFE